MALDPLLDTSTGTSSLPFSALRQVKLAVASLTLHDTWRTLNPRGRDYTFFSSPHNRYSRLDYLFIHQADLSYLYDATIENMILLDHHPITLTLLSLRGKHQPRFGDWMPPYLQTLGTWGLLNRPLVTTFAKTTLQMCHP